MKIKAQILTFREAFYLTEKGREYFQQRLQVRIDTENAAPIELTEINGKWKIGASHSSYDAGDLHRVFWSTSTAGFKMNEFHEEFNRKILEDLMTSIWKR